MGRPRKTPESDPLEPTMREHAKELEAAGVLDEVDRGGPIEQLSELDALELRVAELEQRVAEAGRRALFHARNNGSRVAPVGPILESVGRALLFDTETPDNELEGHRIDPDGEPLEPAAELEGGAGVSGNAETTTLGGDAA